MEAAVIEHEALKLSDSDRAVLIEKLIESISSPGKAQRKEWIRECDERMEALENGDISLIEGDEAIGLARASLRS